MMKSAFYLAAVCLLLSGFSVQANPSFDCRVPGLAGGLWQDGQSPSNGDSYSESQARQRLSVLAQATNSIRLYDAEADAVAACIAKNEFGMQVYLGIWIGSDIASNNAQITAGIDVALNGCADALIVGNEVLLRDDQSPGYLASAIHSVKAQVPSTVKVGTAEVWHELLADKQVIDASEVVLIHAHSYWAGVAANRAVSYANKAYHAVKKIAGDREVILGEVGIPTAGQPRGGAVPSIPNLNLFLLEMTTWATDQDIKVFFFSGFDENWKYGEPGGVGTHWGIFNSDMSFKTGLEEVFDCITQTPVIEPIPPSTCEQPVLYTELLTDPDMGLCSWTPGWVPTTSGSLCLTSQHDRSASGGRGYYNYTAAGFTGTGAFANREQAVSIVGGVGYRTRVFVRAWNLENGPALLRLLFKDGQGGVVVGDEITVDQQEIDEFQEEWYPLSLLFENVPCSAESVELSFGVRKDEPGTAQLLATFDDASLTGFHDNCTDVVNPIQLDTDTDGIGNMCDCDFNQDNFCGGPDFTLFIGCFNSPTNGDPVCEAADMNGDGFVGGPDFTLFISGFNAAPGPAAP